MDTLTAPPTSSRGKWLVLVAMTGSLSMVMLDQTVVTVALPSMARHLHLGANLQQWVVNAYVLALAAVVACGGRLGDRIGRATTFRLGVLLFFLASAACGLAPDPATLIAGRLAQGVGAALMMPASSAIVISAFGSQERGKAMAVYAGISQVFLAVGPLLGGFLTESVSWRAVFWLNVPVGIAALVLVHIARPDNARQPEARISPLHVVLLTGGIGLFVFGIQQASRWGWGSGATIGAIGGGILALAAFIITQLRGHDPLLDIRLFARRSFLGDSVVMGLLQFGLLPVVLYASLYLQDLLGYSPMRAGAATLPVVLPLAAAAQFGGRWFDRSGVRRPVLTGLAIGTVGTALWAASLPQLSYGWMIPGMVLMGLGLGLTMSPANTDGMNRASAAERGQASGLIQTVRQLGGTLGVSIVGALILAMEHHGPAAATSHHSADAIAAGFALAAGSLALALAAGGWLLTRGQQTEAPLPGATEHGHSAITTRPQSTTPY